MSFPFNGVLDDFNRANAASLGANWTAPIRGTDVSLTVTSNVAVPTAGAVADNYWNASTFGPDCEAYFTIASPIAAVTTGVQVWCRINSPGPTVSGYACTWIPVTGSNNDTLDIRRYDNNAATGLGSVVTLSLDPVAGDKIGFECVGSNLNGYVFQSGVWTKILTRIDTTYTSAGYIGIRSADTTGGGAMDDFGGGSLPPSLLGTISRVRYPKPPTTSRQTYTRFPQPFIR